MILDKLIVYCDIKQDKNQDKKALPDLISLICNYSDGDSSLDIEEMNQIKQSINRDPFSMIHKIKNHYVLIKLLFDWLDFSLISLLPVKIINSIFNDFPNIKETIPVLLLLEDNDSSEQRNVFSTIVNWCLIAENTCIEKLSLFFNTISNQILKDKKHNYGMNYTGKKKNTDIRSDFRQMKELICTKVLGLNKVSNVNFLNGKIKSKNQEAISNLISVIDFYAIVLNKKPQAIYNKRDQNMLSEIAESNEFENNYISSELFKSEPEFLDQVQIINEKELKPLELINSNIKGTKAKGSFHSLKSPVSVSTPINNSQSLLNNKTKPNTVGTSSKAIKKFDLQEFYYSEECKQDIKVIYEEDTSIDVCPSKTIVKNFEFAKNLTEFSNVTNMTQNVITNEECALGSLKHNSMNEVKRDYILKPLSNFSTLDLNYVNQLIQKDENKRYQKSYEINFIQMDNIIKGTNVTSIEGIENRSFQKTTNKDSKNYQSEYNIDDM